MPDCPEDLRYSTTHQWARVSDDKIAAIGITDFAQQFLGDVVFVELPEVGKQVRAGEVAASVESVKAVSDVFSPVSGVVVEINHKLDDAPETINESPYGEGWLFRVTPTGVDELQDLLSADEYRRFCDDTDLS